MGLTSLRLPSYRHPEIMTHNHPDTDHWTAQRFVFKERPGDHEIATQYVRIPKGEYASESDRAKWAKALSNRPDMLRRLINAEFGAVILGPQVAVGFNPDQHVRACTPLRGVPVWIGQDGGHTPTTVIGQRAEGRCRILGALSSEHAGIRQHVRDLVRPWLGEHAPWALDDKDLLYGRYDSSMNTDDFGDSDSNPVHVLTQEMLPGHWQPGPVSWDGRKDPMLALLNSMSQGEPVLQVDPVQARGLVRALDTGRYYPMGPDGRISKSDTASGSAQPKKPNHPHEDYGDAFCYLVAGMAPTKPQRPANYRTPKAQITWTPFRYARRER